MLNADTTGAERFTLTLHELAHLWVHAIVDEPIVYDVSPPWYREQEEHEANVFAEMLIAGPDGYSVGKPATVKKPRRKSAASNVPLGTRQPPGAAPLPKQLRFLDDHPDETMLREVARDAARSDAKRAPAPGRGKVQFAVTSAAWSAIELARLQMRGVAIPHYENSKTGANHELVTCDLEAAKQIVELLVRAGYKRTAVYVRRTIREHEDPYEVRQRQRAHLVKEGAKHVTAEARTWVRRS